MFVKFVSSKSHIRMKALHHEVKIPEFLHELHGQKATVFDLLLTYLGAVLTTALVLYQAQPIGLEAWQYFLLGFLTLDLAGGVVANFTAGTTQHYKENPGKRYLFIALHVLQPLLLYLTFSDPANMLPLLLITVYAVIAMLVINNIREYAKQRIMGAFLLVLGVTIAFLEPFSQPLMLHLVLLYLVKLLLAFAVRWA